MTILWISLGVCASLLSLAAMAFALGFLIKACGAFMESLGQFFPPAVMALERAGAAQASQQTEAILPREFAGPDAMTAWPRRATPGVAPAPIDMTSATTAKVPDNEAGDADLFDAEAIERLRRLNASTTPVLPGSTVGSETR